MSAKSLKSETETVARKEPRRRRGRWWKIPLMLLSLVLLVVAVAWVLLSEIATWVLNNKGSEYLGAEVSVERVELRPMRGQVAVHGLRMGQPEGFGDGAMVELGRVTAHVDLKSIRGGDEILVRVVELEDLTAHVIKNADGVLNVSRLGPSPADAAADGGSDGGGGEDEAAADAGGSSIPGVSLERVDVAGISVRYTDLTAGARPVEITLGNMGIALRDGRVDLAESPTVRLGEGSITLEDVHISQPDDFGEDALLELARVHLDLGDRPFVDQVVRLERLEVSGLRVHLIRNTHGVMNVARLGGGPPPQPPPADSADAEATEVAEAAPEPGAAADEPGEVEPSEVASAAAPAVGVVLGALEVSDVGITYTDGALGKEVPLEFEIRDLGLSIRDLTAFSAEPAAPSSSVELRASVAQGDHPDAQVGLVAMLGPISAGIPDLNAQVLLTGLMLETLGSLVPPGVRQSLGANGMDVGAGIALNARSIDLEGAVDTDAGHSYSLLVKGPLAKPEVELGPLMFAVVGRLAGGVGNLTAGTAGAAINVAEGMAGGATEIGKGAAGLVGNVGGGLLRTAAGAATGDLGKIGEGLKGATSDAVKDATGAVGDAGGRMADKANEGVQSATGSRRTADWLQALDERHHERLTVAREALGAMPFPPPDISGAEIEAPPADNPASESANR